MRQFFSWNKKGTSGIEKEPRDLEPSEAKRSAVTDSTERPEVTEAKRKFQAFMTEDLTPEEAARVLHAVIRATDSAGFKLNVKGVHAMISRLRELGFDGESTFNAFQDSGRTMPYSATDALNSIRAHCEKLMKNKYTNANESDTFNLLRSEIILEHN